MELRPQVHLGAKALDLHRERRKLTPAGFHHGSRDNPVRCPIAPAFEAWLLRAAPGTWCCYFEGALGAAREAPPLRLNADAAIRLQNAAEAIGEATYRAYVQGFVVLCQARHPLGLGFRYYAIRTHKRAYR